VFGIADGSTVIVAPGQLPSGRVDGALCFGHGVHLHASWLAHRIGLIHGGSRVVCVGPRE
jgi:hypothetical protein